MMGDEADQLEEKKKLIVDEVQRKRMLMKQNRGRRSKGSKDSYTFWSISSLGALGGNTANINNNKHS